MTALSERERKVLAVMNRTADLTIPEVAQQTGYRIHTVRHILNGLAERQALQASLVLDELKLGLHKYEMLLSLAPRSLELIPAIERALIEPPHVTWITKLTGAYDYHLSICVADLEEIGHFFDWLRHKFGAVFSKHSIALYRGWRFFGLKYLTGERPAAPIISTGFCNRGTPPDDSDLAIISALSKNPLGSSAQIARTVGLPSATTAYRLSRLYKIGVIQHPILRLRMPKVVTKYKVILKSRCPSEKSWIAVHNFSASHPNVVDIVRVLGDWDYQLQIEVEDHALAQNIVKELEIKFGEELQSAQLFEETADLKFTADPAKAMLSARQDEAKKRMRA